MSLHGVKISPLAATPHLNIEAVKSLSLHTGLSTALNPTIPLNRSPVQLAPAESRIPSHILALRKQIIYSHFNLDMVKTPIT